MNIFSELDDQFCRHELGGVLFKNAPADNLPFLEQDYVTIFVPKCLVDRFEDFWTQAAQVFGNGLEILRIQEGVGLPRKGLMHENLYFIPVKSAELLLQHLDGLVPQVQEHA